MSSKIKNLVYSGLFVSSLILSAAPAMAWDWPWANHNDRYAQRDRDAQRNDRRDEWDSRWGHGKDYNEYQQARQQALYDASHGASRKKIAEDDARADEILDRMRHGHH